MTLSHFIKDNTNDGHDIASVLIDVMKGRIDGSKVGHRLTAARLLIIYGSQSAVAGHEDADDFIADNTPITTETDTDDRVWVNIDPALTRLIRFKTDDGRAMCLFLIEVMQGKVEGINVGHRVSAAKELLNRGFGRYQSRPLPKPPGSTAPKRSTHKTHQRVAPDQTQAVATTHVPQAVVLSEPDKESRHLAYGGYIDDDIDPDPWLAVYDSKLYEFLNECEDPDFDPSLAARDEEYLKSYTGCKDPECEVHGDPPEIILDPNDYHY